MNMQAAPIFSSVTDEPLEHEAWVMARAGGVALEMLTQMLPESASQVEKASHDLTHQFKTIAHSASAQSEMMQALIATIGAIQVEEKKVTLDEFIALFSKTLDDSISKILFVSKKAVSMVYSMSDAIQNLREIEKFSQKIQAITKQSNLLAFNAMIESARAGNAVRGFSVVANEMKILSGEIAGLSEEMRRRTQVIMTRVTEGFDMLQEVATIDMNDHMMVKDRLDVLLQGLVRQSDESRKVIAASATTSSQMSQAIDDMVMNLQFQDRNSQVTENAVDIIRQCMLMLHAIEHKAEGEAVADHPANLDRVQKGVESILAVIKLGDIRRRYSMLLQKHGLAPSVALEIVEPPASVELF